MSNNFKVKHGLEVAAGVTITTGGINVTGAAALDSLTLVTPLPAIHGGTGTTTSTGTGSLVLSTSPTFTGTVAGITSAMVGLGNVANTTDLLKPISTATQTALELKATQSTTYTKVESDAAIQTVVSAAPAALATLQAIGAQLATDGSAAGALTTAISLKAPIASPAFTGTVTGITSAMVGLANVANTTDLLKPISTATQTALALKAPIASPAFTGTVTGITSAMVGLANVANTTDLLKPISTATQTALDLKAPIASPTFTGTVTGITPAMVGLGNVANTTDLLKPISTATQTALDLKATQSTTYTKVESDAAIQAVVSTAPAALATLQELDTLLATDGSAAGALTTAISLKAPIASPAFTGTVTGITPAMVGLGNVANTTDLLKPISTATQTALDLKAALASPAFTGTVTGITPAMVGLGNVANTTDLLKPISTATQTALDLKASLTSPTLITPILGVASATTVNKVTLSQPATGATLTLAEGAVLETVGAHRVTLTAIAPTNVTLPVTGTLITNTVATLPSLASVGTITTGVWSGSFGVVSGAALTNLTASTIEGTLPAVVLGNSNVYIGATPIALNRATGSVTLSEVSITGAAGALTTSTGAVSVSSATAPTAGQVLTAINGTSAEWTSMSAGSTDLSTASGTLAVSHGGTGSTTATGTGSTVLGTSPAITTALTTPSTSFSLVNTTATTVNFAGAATTVNIGSALPGTTTINNDLVVAGNITFGSGATQLSATVINVDDTLIYMADNNIADLLDIGFVGAYENGGHKHTGMVRDATDKVWKFFSGLTAEPTSNVIDFTGAVYDNLQIGNLVTTGVNKVVITTPANGATMTLANNSSLVTVGGNSLTLTTSGTTSVTLPVSGTLLADSYSVLLGTTPVPLNRASAALVLTGVNIDGYAGSLQTTGGSVVVSAAAAPSIGQVLMATGATAATWQTPAAGGTGTVTSVALTVPSFLSVVNSPVTTSGSLNVTLSGTALPVLNGGTGTTTSVGSGSVVLATSPTLTTPVLGVASTTSINKVAITAPTTSATLTLADGSSLVTVGTNSLTLTTTAATNVTLPVSGTLLADSYSVRLGTTSVPLNRASAALVLTGVSVDGYAGSLQTTGGAVVVSAAAAPSIGQVLMATGATAATWQTPAAGGTGTVTSVAALTVGSTGTDITSTVATGTTTPVITVNVPTASASNRGALSAADWTTFNAKAPIASPTFTGTVGGVTASFSGAVSDLLGNLRSIPQSNKTGAYSLVAADNGRNINITTGGITIPTGVFAIGDVISIYNQSDVTQSVTCSGLSAYVAGTAGTKTSVTLAIRGVLTIMFVTTSEIVLSGNI